MQRKLTVVICSVVLVTCLLWIWRWNRPDSVKVDSSAIVGLNTGFGQVLAEETAQAVHDHGNIILVTMDSPAHATQPDDRRSVFESELSKHGAIHITAIEAVKLERNTGREFWPSGAFRDLLQRYASADALVFFVELPDWLTVADSIPTTGTPKFIAVDNQGQLTRIHYEGYFSRGILAALIGAPTRPLTGQPTQPTTPREWFNKYYQVYTPQNYESLP